MKCISTWVTVALLAAALTGCASGQAQPAASGMPCENCKYGVRSVGKALPVRVFCVVDGKEVDCRKTPAECPECKKMHGGN